MKRLYTQDNAVGRRLLEDIHPGYFTTERRQKNAEL